MPEYRVQVDELIGHVFRAPTRIENYDSDEERADNPLDAAVAFLERKYHDDVYDSEIEDHLSVFNNPEHGVDSEDVGHPSLRDTWAATYRTGSYWFLVTVTEMRPHLPSSITVPTQAIIDHVRWCFRELDRPTSDIERMIASANIGLVRGMLTLCMGYSEREELFRQARDAAKDLPN
jgi:hypothetical protein